jgi:3-oxoacyl-[acyl-carrier-protein] synthase II
MQPVITGFGLVTPLGLTADATWRAILRGEHISDHTPLESMGGPSRIGSLGQAAARQAIEQAAWSSQRLREKATALVIGTSKGDIRGNEARDSTPFSIFHFPLSLQTGGPRTTLSAACASGLHALIHASLLLRSPEVDRVLVIAAEASVLPLFIASFQRMGVLSPPERGCRPFDQGRQGFLMSEAAAAVCLEKSTEAGDRAIVAVDGFAWGADAHHLTSGDPSGQVLRHLIAQAVGTRQVDLIHAHGTGTIHNDAVELAAIEGMIGDDSPILFSHKGALGHSLGAAGLVSIVLNCLSHRYGLVPPNVRTLHPMPTRLTLRRDVISHPIRRSVALAAGFGGSMAAVTLESIEGALS